MSDIYPLVIVKDRYNGTYSGGKWTAWNLSYVPSKVDADDGDCCGFFSAVGLTYGRGETPEEAIDDLKFFIQYGNHIKIERIKPVNESTEDEEEEKMEPTSVWKEDLKQEIRRLTDQLVNTDKENAKLKKELHSLKLEKTNLPKTPITDAMLVEDYNRLVKENEELKAKSKDISDDNALLLETNRKLKKKIDILQRKYDIEKAANEAHHKFFRQYAGKDTEIEFNYVIDEANEVTYVIVDKERYQTLKAGSYCAMIHGKIYNTDQLVDRILELEEALKFLRDKYEALRDLKSPTVENFADERPSTRADILDQAKKCVCGQREQDYGTPESNFQLIADLWNAYLGFTSYVLELEEYLMDLKDKGIDIDIDVPEPKAIFPEDVAMMMALLKIARIRNGGGSGDSFVDLAGYAACGGEIWAGEKKNKDQK